MQETVSEKCNLMYKRMKIDMHKKAYCNFLLDK